MRLTPDFERTLRRYVLGDLEDDVRSELEELLVTDPEAFEALGVIEDELMDEYLAESVSAAERRGFEQHFLISPQGRHRLRVARALKHRANASPFPQHADPRITGTASVSSPGWRPAWVGLAAALAVSLFGNAWLALRHLTLEAPLERPSVTGEAAPPTLPALATPSPHAPPAASPASGASGSAAESVAASPELSAALAREQLERVEAEAGVRTLGQQAQRSRAPVVTFTLAAGLLRSAGSLPRVSVPKDALVVRLRLDLPGDDYPLYRAALLDGNGDEVWAASKLRGEGQAGQPAVVLVLPSELLPRGDYQVKLSGVTGRGDLEAVATYPLRVSTP
jgi:anti-sigma factor RsiW